MRTDAHSKNIKFIKLDGLFQKPTLSYEIPVSVHPIEVLEEKRNKL